jgi:hypothetical protein
LAGAGECAATLNAELPKLNVSRVLRDALLARLACRHEGALTCAGCGVSVEPAVLRLETRRSLYDEIYRRLAELVPHGGSVQGAARVVNNVAERFGVPIWPEIRTTRAERESLRDAERAAG